MLHSQRRKFPLSSLTEHICDIEEANGLVDKVGVVSELWAVLEFVELVELMMARNEEGLRYQDNK